MYSENNRRASGMRANDEFLRRMLGGDLTGGELPVMNMEHLDRSESFGRGNDGSRADGMNISDRVRLSDEGSSGGGRPSCDGTVSNGKPSCDDRGECPSYLHAPSLAMVYAPRQCWRNLLDLQSALENGTLFAELVLPFEAGNKRMGTEGNGRKC